MYQFTIPTGLSIKDFEEHTDAIAHFLEVDTDSQLYKCECGSSTFTPLNISEDFDIEILNY